MFNWRTASGVLIVCLLLVYAAVFYQLRRQLFGGYSDFISFYTAGKILQRGAGHQLYDLDVQYGIQREVAPNVKIRSAALPFVRLPFEAWLFLPFAYLPYRAAFISWNLFSCGCLLGTVVILRREIPELRRFSLAFTFASVLSYFPVFVTILQGQDSILLLMIYVLAYKLLSENSYFASGMILGLGIIKFPLVLPFLILFIVRKKLSVLSGFVVSSLLLLGISVATVGVSTAASYPKFLLSIDRVAMGVNVPQDMPNLRGLLSVFPQAKLTHTMDAALLALLSLLLVIFAVRNWQPGSHNGRAGLRLGFSLNLVITILVSYHCHSFDLCLLGLPMSLTLAALLSGQFGASRKVLMWSLGAVAFSPFYIVFSFVLKSTSLIALLLLIFSFAIGKAISELRRGSPVADRMTFSLPGS